MAVEGRLLVNSQERLDLPDLLSIESYVSGDFRSLIKSFVGSRSLVLKGYDIIDAPASIGTRNVSIRIADSVLYNPLSSAGSFHYGLPEGNVLAIPLTPTLHLNATNYVYVTVSSTGTAKDSRAFFDIDANGGEGAEYSQEVNTESMLVITAGVSTSMFPVGSIAVAKVVMNGSSIASITDCRNMMFRLGSGGASPDPFSTYDFRPLPSIAYERDEPFPTISGSSGVNPFFGGDKNIYSMKEWMDAVMTKLLELGGTTYWYESTPDLSILSIFDDALGSSLKSKGQWKHDSSIAGKITWSEDIVYRKMNDPRDIIIRGNASTGVTLANEEILWMKMVREKPVNGLSIPLDFVNAVPYINGTSGAFANLAKGDWIKRDHDAADLYLRVESFRDDFNGGGSSTSAALALSVILNNSYAGPTITDIATYTKGEYQNSDLVVSSRTDVASIAAGGDFYWLVNRSDTIENVSSIDPTVFSANVDIIDSDGQRAKLNFPSAHGLSNGDRVVVSGASLYNGTYQIEVESATVAVIQTSETANPVGITVSWSIITTAARSTAYSYQLESANHGFKSNETIIVAGTGSAYDSYQSGKYLVNYRTATTVQIPYNANDSVGAVGTATAAKVILKTEFGEIEIVQGETININEPDTANILSFIGMDSLAQTTPVYSVPSGYNALSGFHNYNSSDLDNLTARASKLTAMMADRVQDRGLKILNRIGFRNETSGGNQIVTVSGGNLLVEKPGSAQQTISFSGSFSLAANQALVATIDRNASGTITPTTESLGSPFLIAENKLILFYRFSDTSIHAWDGAEVKNSSSWTSSDPETSQNKNVVVQDKAGASYNSTTKVLSYNTTVDFVHIIIPGSANTNLIDPVAINALTPTINDGQSAWIRINRFASKTINTVSTSPTAQDSNSAGTLYITDWDQIPTDQDVFVLYTVNGIDFIEQHHQDPRGNTYEEEKVGVLIPANSNQFTTPLTAPTIVTLPNDSRNGGEIQYYVVGSGQLEVFLNGKKLRKGAGIDYTEVGTLGDVSNRIQMEMDLVTDDVLTFRIGSFGAVYFTPVPPNTATLQTAYSNGNTITTTSGNPITISGPAEKLLVVNGDITVTGVIDPKGITFSNESANPINNTQYGIWVNAVGNLRYSKLGVDTPVSGVAIGSPISGTSNNGVLYINSSGNLAQNTNFVFDGARLGVGTSTPIYDFELANDGGRAAAVATSYNSVAGTSANFIGRRARGTKASPTAILTGDVIGNFSARGYGTTGFAAGATANMRFEAAENWTDTANGSNTTFFTTLNGGTAATEKMRLTGVGALGIGTTSPASKLHVKDASDVGIAVESTTPGTAGAQFTAYDGNVLAWIIARNGAATFGSFTNHQVYLVVNQTTVAIAIDTSGKVGIGTTSPDSRLHVVGQSHLDNARIGAWESDSTFFRAVNQTYWSGDSTKIALAQNNSGFTVIDGSVTSVRGGGTITQIDSFGFCVRTSGNLNAFIVDSTGTPVLINSLSYASWPSVHGATGSVLTDTTGLGALVWKAPLSGNSAQTTWLNAAGTTKSIAHSLGSTNVEVSIYDTATGETIVPDTVTRTDANNITITVSVAPAVGWTVNVFRTYQA